MKKILVIVLSLLLLIQPVCAQSDRFVPTPQEQAAAAHRQQSGIISYDAVADTDMSANLLMTAAIIAAAIACIIILFTVIVLVRRKKRAKDRAAQK